jgi:hypothetical protein
MAKKNSKTAAAKPTGINQGIQEGMSPEQFQGRVICKKCGKDIEFTLGSQLFQRCPRCNIRVERDIASEEKQARKIVKWDILRRSKKTMLTLGFILTLGAIAYNVIGHFTDIFDDGHWWFALFSLPAVVCGYLCINITRFRSASKLYKFYAWLAVGLCVLALLIIIATAVPAISVYLK